MVKRPLALVSLVAILAAGAWFVHGWIWPDESARVRATVDALADAVTALGAAGPGAGQLGGLADLRTLLAEDVTLEAPQRSVVVEGRDQVLGLAAQFGSATTRPALSFVDVAVVLSAGDTVASVEATAELVETRADGAQSLDAQPVELVWVRQGRSWMLRSAKVIKVLR